MTGDPGGYRQVMRRLAELDAQAAAHRAQAETWYRQRCAAAEAAVAANAEALDTAQAQVAAARRVLEVVEAEAAILWSEFVHREGATAERLGRTVPHPTVPQQRGAREPQDYLQEVRARLRPAQPARRPVGTPARSLLGLLGALGGVLGFAAATGLRWAGQRTGGDWAVVLPVLALIVTVVGPAVGVAAAKRLADRRGTGLDAAAVGTVLVVGLVTAGALTVATR